MPGLTGRLYNQFAMTIVFSFLFSAFNSLTFSPAMARLFLRPEARRDEVLPVPLVQPRPGLDREFLRRVPRMRRPTTGGRSSLPSLGLLALTGWMIAERPKAFIPTEDQGYLIVVVQTPDGTSGSRPPDHPAASARSPGSCRGSSDVADPRRPERDHLDQPDQLRHGVRHPRGLAAPRRRRSCGRPAWPRSSSGRLPSRSATPW